MDYCSPIWPGTPVLHLEIIDAVETQALKILGISYSEAESGPVTFALQTSWWPLFLILPPFWSCSFYPILPPVPPSTLHISAEYTQSVYHLLLVNSTHLGCNGVHTFIIVMTTFKIRRALGRAHTSATQCLIHENISGPIHFWNIMPYIVFGTISRWWRITF